MLDQEKLKFMLAALIVAVLPAARHNGDELRFFAVSAKPRCQWDRFP